MFKVEFLRRGCFVILKYRTTGYELPTSLCRQAGYRLVWMGCFVIPKRSEG